MQHTALLPIKKGMPVLIEVRAAGHHGLFHLPLKSCSADKHVGSGTAVNPNQLHARFHRNESRADRLSTSHWPAQCNGAFAICLTQAALRNNMCLSLLQLLIPRA